MISLKTLITEARLKSVTVMTDVILQKMAAAAQKIYDDWDQNPETDELNGGGICHLIADDLAGILCRVGIEASTVSSNFEQHVYVVAKFREGVYQIDIPYHTYEQGGGYTWKKLPGIAFDSSHVSIYKIDSNPRNFHLYIDPMEENLNEIKGYDPLIELMGEVKRLEINLKIKYPQLADLTIFLKSDGQELHLDSIRMKPNLKGHGIGGKVVQEICNFADEKGMYITLRPIPDKGYKEKLLRFYKQFGFYPNKGRYGLSQFGSAFGVDWIRRPKQKKEKSSKPLTEIESPHEPAKDTDIKRGYLGTVYGNEVIGYDQLLPNVMQVDHSELPYGRAGSRFRYFVQRPWNTILWSEFPPSPKEKEIVVIWLSKKGVENPRDISLNDYNHIYNRPNRP